jgi:uncharacterized RDD family membrane protein YckC
MEERHGWVLATFLQRLAAYLIDTVLFYLPLLVIILTLLGGMIGVMLGSLALLVGYVIWWLFALRRGQTPGKRLVGIRVIKDNGEPSGWGYTFLREFVIKELLGGFLSGMTGGIYFAAAHLWPLWDRDRQALHDKMIGTLVVQNRR